MNEYIKREDALQATTYMELEPSSDDNIIKLTLLAAQKVIRRIPPADVVEVVRCKECKYSEDLGMAGIWCNHPDNRNPLGCRPTDYCNDGERKESK